MAALSDGVSEQTFNMSWGTALGQGAPHHTPPPLPPRAPHTQQGACP